MEKWRRYRHPHVYRDQPPKKRLTLSWRPSRRVIMIVVFGAMIGSAAWLFFASSVFVVTSVQASGEVTAQLQEKLESIKGQRIFSVSESALLAELTTVDPSVATIVLTKGFPSEIQCAITRRHPSLIWKTGDIAWAIDRDGVAFPLDPTTAEGVPVIIDERAQTVSAGTQILSAGFVSFVQTALEELPKKINAEIGQSVVGETTFHIRFVSSFGWGIILDTTRPLSGQLINLELILKDYRPQVHEYIDLRLPGWAYIK